MASREEKYYKRRLSSSYLTAIISIMLVLFTLGFLGFVVINASSLSNYIKENIGFEIIMKQDAREADIVYLQKILDAQNYVKSTEYITKEEALKRLSNALGEDFTSFLGNEEKETKKTLFYLQLTSGSKLNGPTMTAFPGSRISF